MFEELRITHPNNAQYCVVPGAGANLILNRRIMPFEKPRHIRLTSLKWQSDLIEVPVDPSCEILKAVTTTPVKNVTATLGFKDGDGSPIFAPNQQNYCAACPAAENCLYSYEGMLHRSLLAQQETRGFSTLDKIMLVLYTNLGNILTANQIATKIGNNPDAIKTMLSRKRPNCINSNRCIHGGYEMPEAPLEKCGKCPLQRHCTFSSFLTANK